MMMQKKDKAGMGMFILREKKQISVRSTFSANFFFFFSFFFFPL